MPRNPKSTNPIDQAFSREVLLARAITGLSQEKAAGLADLGRDHISWIENGHGTNLRTAVKLARFYGISIDKLYGIEAK